MSRSTSAEEWKQEYLDSMGPELGGFFYLLVNDCLALHLEWAEFKVLYGDSQERIELLNRAAPAFFARLQNTLWEMILLRIARLTMDAPKSGAGKDNLTLRKLPELVEASIRSQVEILVEDAKRKCAFSSDWRNRRIAHKDLSLALKVSQKPLSSASRLSVGNALEAIVTVLNTAESHYLDGRTVAYSWAESAFGSKALLYTLREGIEARESRKQRLKSGNYLPEDIAPKQRL